MEPPKCKVCGERGWNHVCFGLMSLRGGGESRPAARMGKARGEPVNRGDAPHLEPKEVTRTPQAGIASGPRKAKRGRPRLEDRGKPKPWETAGMSRASWYRRKAEKAKNA